MDPRSRRGYSVGDNWWTTPLVVIFVPMVPSFEVKPQAPRLGPAAIVCGGPLIPVPVVEGDLPCRRDFFSDAVGCSFVP